jgi:hypothetical protein
MKYPTPRPPTRNSAEYERFANQTAVRLGFSETDFAEELLYNPLAHQIIEVLSRKWTIVLIGDGRVEEVFEATNPPSIWSKPVFEPARTMVIDENTCLTDAALYPIKKVDYKLMQVYGNVAFYLKSVERESEVRS